MKNNLEIAIKYLYDNFVGGFEGDCGRACLPDRFIKKRKRYMGIRSNKQSVKKTVIPSFTHALMGEIKKIKSKQIDCNRKLDKLIGGNSACSSPIVHEVKSLEVHKFNFDILQNPGDYDYFSFKIKTDHVQTEGGAAGSGHKVKKSSSPDGLINHKFFEDTDTFRVNLEKTIELTKDNLQNPFCVTQKSCDSNLRSHSNPHRLSNANIFTTRANATKTPSDHSASETEKLPLKTNTLECTNSEIAESESQCSSKYLCGSSISQEGFKKVRGFNFKNNINTKKFNKPLIRQKTQEDQIMEIKELENVIADVVIQGDKVKRFNFNNNINLKKFIRKGSNTIDGDSCSLSINDLNK
jgi:hypothetical protein